MELTPSDIQQLEALGIDPARAERQLAMLRAGQAWMKLERPCRPGDGIIQLDRSDLTVSDQLFEQAVDNGRLMRFVPASGAASRMFAPLHAEPEVFEAARAPQPGPKPDEAELGLRRFFDNLKKFAFFSDLAQAMDDDGLDIDAAIARRDVGLLIRYLLEPCGLGYDSLPKGLLAFHAEIDGVRTPFVEHQAEAALLCGPGGNARLHFTVSPDHLALFKAQYAAWQHALEQTYGALIEVSYSVQKPSTDTLALGADGGPLRDADGRLILRPGGHGALLENLENLRGDLLLVRNIDNVVPDRRKSINLETTRALTGLLLNLQKEQHALLRGLHADGDEPILRDLCFAFLCDRLQLELPFDAELATLVDLLDRPLRVCGMVANEGEPGGGPFWVRGADGRLTPQIVEGAQIDQTDPDQVAILKQSTHFNPVDMACAVRNWRGEPYDLSRFVDAEAVIVTEKDHEGQTIRALELPGLWNGAMAHWHTLFVEIPAEAFNPVKTVFDLLRPAHQI